MSQQLTSLRQTVHIHSSMQTIPFTILRVKSCNMVLSQTLCSKRWHLSRSKACRRFRTALLKKRNPQLFPTLSLFYYMKFPVCKSLCCRKVYVLISWLHSATARFKISLYDNFTEGYPPNLILMCNCCERFCF